MDDLQITDHTKKVSRRLHRGFKRTMPVKTLVVHGTAGGGTLHWVANAPSGSARYRNYRRGVALFHYLIERDGSIHQLVDPSRWVYHSSVGKYDAGTIGVELLNPTRDNSGHYTSKQYDALVALFKALREDFPLSAMAGHGRMKNKYSGGWKNCPGRGFVWPSLARRLTAEFEFVCDLSKYESIWSIIPR